MTSGWRKRIRDLEVDAAGPIRTPAEKREALLAEFDRSGMTGVQFARFSGLRYPTLMNCLQKRRSEAEQSEQMAARRQDHPRWLKARVEGEVSKTENIVVEMGHGVRMLVDMTLRPHWRGELLRAMGLGRDVEFFGKPAGVRGGGGLQHAKGL